MKYAYEGFIAKWLDEGKITEEEAADISLLIEAALEGSFESGKWTERNGK